MEYVRNKTRMLVDWHVGPGGGSVCQSYVEIVPVPGVSTSTFPTSINEAGSVTGSYHNPPGNDFTDDFVLDAGGTITTFDASNFLFKSAQTFGINDAGAITGNYFRDLQFDSGGFVRDPQGNFTYFDPPGSISTIPQSINAGGVITGYYGSNGMRGFGLHGFVRYDNGTVISFDPPGSIQTTGLSINSRGEITGYYHEANDVVHGFVRRADGTIVTFDAPASTGTFPASINDAGAITGHYTALNGGAYGFVRDPHGDFTSFDAGGYTFPASINKEGAITGFYSNVSQPGPYEGISRGFVRSAQGKITPFDPNNAEPTLCNPPPSGSLVFPTSINRAGVITGYCYYTPNPLLNPYLRVAQGWVRLP